MSGTDAAGKTKFSVDQVKGESDGRWLEIIPALSGIPADSLDGKHQPCPMCGGDDRFRAFDDFAETGGVICNQCGGDLGDGLATLQWANGWDFSTAIRETGSYVGLTEAPAIADHVATWARHKHGVNYDAAISAGAESITFCGHPCVSFPCFSPVDGQTGQILFRADGIEFGPGKKSHNVKGSTDGWVVVGDFGNSENILKTEGVPDALAIAPHLPDGWAVVTNICGCKSWPIPQVFRGKRLHICHDSDMPGQAGAAKGMQLLSRVSPDFQPVSVENVVLPFAVVDDGGKDLRDWVNDGNGWDDFVRLDRAEHVVVAQQETTTTTAATIQPGDRVIAGDRGNIGTVLTVSGDQASVQFVGSDGTATKDFQLSELKHPNGQLATETRKPLTVMDAATQIGPSRLRPIIIDGLLRRGETCNIVAAPKTNKSWLSLGLAMSVATGRQWLDYYKTEPGKVAILDNELHPETLQYRLTTVANSLGITADELEGQLQIVPMRGNHRDVDSLADAFELIDGGVSLIVLDAFYRLLPAGMNENDNAAMTQVYNTLDRYADQLNAAFVVIHHTSKGDQAGKKNTDVGSGAGSISRAVDVHLTLRPHDEDGYAVMNANLRSFPPMDSQTLHWRFPVWTMSSRPAVLLRNPGQRDKDKEACDQIVALLAAVGEMSVRQVRKKTSMGKDRVERIIAQLISQRLVIHSGDDTARNGTEFPLYSINDESDSDGMF